MDNSILKKIKKSIDSWNINFLFGSWLSRPLLDTLNWIEDKLTEAEKTTNNPKTGELKKEYFEKCMKWNISVFESRNWDETLENYKNFYKVINQILLERDNSLLTKQVNIFTTNIDILSEIALEETWLEFNDWFHWRFNPRYEVWNFKKSVFMKSLHYENTSEIPNFNILKLHGSLSWNEKDRKILLDKNLELVRELEKSFDESKFDELMIINPKKTKFEDTIFNQYSYDLLRMYSNELEKENSILFVMWFSFADEHIRDLTLRVANSNPTLKIYIFKNSPKKSIDQQTLNDQILVKLEHDAKNKNIEVLYPEWEIKNYDFKTIIKEIFQKIPWLEEKLTDDSLNLTETKKQEDE